MASSSAFSRNWDCDGSQCHGECQLRHLDPVEKEIQQEQQQNSVANNPSVVITASRDMGRTASTWVFNAVRLLYRQAREPCDSYWVRELSRDEIQNRMRNNSDEENQARHVVIKTHEWTPYTTKQEMEETIRPLMTHVIVSVRDGFPPDPNWMQYATHILHYEDIVNPERVQTVLRNLAAHLGISHSLTENDIKEVDYHLMSLPTPQFGSDPITKLWSFHARKGGRKAPENPCNKT